MRLNGRLNERMRARIDHRVRKGRKSPSDARSALAIARIRQEGGTQRASVLTRVPQVKLPTSTSSATKPTTLLRLVLRRSGRRPRCICLEACLSKVDAMARADPFRKSISSRREM